MSSERVAPMNSTYTVRAVKWSGGWELHIDGEGVTQVRTLDKAVDQVRDYLGSLRDRDMSQATIAIEPDLGGLEKAVREARAGAVAAAKAQIEAAAAQRSVVKALRDEGLSVTDAAAVLGVSRGRISQLTG